MSSVQLLDKTRKIGKLLHNNNSSKVVFNDICRVMREILNSNILVISKKGKVLGVGEVEGIAPPSRLRVRDLEPCSSISRVSSMILTILFFLSTEPLLWVLKCSELSMKRVLRRREKLMWLNPLSIPFHSQRWKQLPISLTN